MGLMRIKAFFALSTCSPRYCYRSEPFFAQQKHLRIPLYNPLRLYQRLQMALHRYNIGMALSEIVLEYSQSSFEVSSRFSQFVLLICRDP